MTAVIDLHTHSTCSDGTDTPAELVAKAQQTGVTVLGLTDHDTTSGWAAAGAAAERCGIQLVRGIELSTRNEGTSQHLLAYEPEPAHPGLVELLERGRLSREGRVPETLRRLHELGVDLAVEEVERFSGHGSTGRPHVADALVAAGHCRTRREAFDRFLAAGGPAYVRRWLPTIEEAIAVVRDAGGVTVIAHPWGRGGSVSAKRFAELAELGLSGIEVDHVEHDDDARRRLRGVARELGLVVTGSSDYHGTGKVGHDLGCNTTEREVLDQLLEMVVNGATSR